MAQTPFRERRDFYVYALVDPRDGQVFYVGKGCRGRAWVHERQVLKGHHRNWKVADRILSICRSRQRPAVVTLASELAEREALDREREEIHGRPDLCNLWHHDGESGRERMRARARAQIRRWKPFRDWVREAPRSAEAVRAYYGLLAAVAREVANPSPNVFLQHPDGTVTVRWEPD